MMSEASSDSSGAGKIIPHYSLHNAQAGTVDLTRSMTVAVRVTNTNPNTVLAALRAAGLRATLVDPLILIEADGDLPN
jgi:hypothetical protein